MSLQGIFLTILAGIMFIVLGFFMQPSSFKNPVETTGVVIGNNHSVEIEDGHETDRYEGVLRYTDDRGNKYKHETSVEYTSPWQEGAKYSMVYSKGQPEKAYMNEGLGYYFRFYGYILFFITGTIVLLYGIRLGLFAS